jgi:signal transduction histidine kinase
LLLWFYYRKMNVLNRKLNESNKIKDKLFSIIGHDLKAPVGGLVQTLELLEGDDLTAEERKYVIGQLRKQTQLSLDTLNALLNWGEAQLKGVSVNEQHFETKGIISKNVELLSKQAAEKNISITDNTTESVTVLADVNHFDVVVRNLLSNAVKFTNEHGTVEINAMETGKDGMIVFSVKDNGQGISAEQQQQFLSSNINVSFGTKGEKGTGLGLLLTKEFILANGGKIWLESKVGEGTTFYFSLKKIQQ